MDLTSWHAICQTIGNTHWIDNSVALLPTHHLLGVWSVCTWSFPHTHTCGVGIGHLGTPMVFTYHSVQTLLDLKFSFGWVSQKLHNLVSAILFLAPLCTRGLTWQLCSQSVKTWALPIELTTQSLKSQHTTSFGFGLFAFGQFPTPTHVGVGIVHLGTPMVFTYYSDQTLPNLKFSFGGG